MDVAVARRYEWLLTSWSRSASFDQYRARLSHLGVQPERERLMLAILLVETTQRPPWFRALEWLMHYACQALAIPTLGPRTLGPFQIRDAPRSFQDAAVVASRLLDGIANDDLASVAKKWNGSLQVHWRSSFSYQEALRMAIAVLADDAGSNPLTAGRTVGHLRRCGRRRRSSCARSR